MPSIRHVVKLAASPDIVRAALTDQEQVQNWWTREAEVDPYVGGQVKADFRGDDAFARFTIDDLTDRRILWRCTDSWMVDSRDWTSTTITWLIEPWGAGTRLTLLHEGFRSESRCFKVCDDGWAFYVGESLKGLVDHAHGMPYDPEVHSVAETM